MRKNSILYFLSLSIIILFSSFRTAAKPQAPRPMKVIPTTTEMLYHDFDRKENTCAKDPTVIRVKNTYYMYYTLPAYDANKKPSDINPRRAGWHAGVAKSRDLVHWRKISDVDLLTSSGKETGGCVAPCVKVIDGTIHMFYQNTNPKTGFNAIWHATSKDGVCFVNTVDEPVFYPKNSWSSASAIDAEVYRVGDKLVLIYVTRDKETRKIQMTGMAEAPYGSDYGPGDWTDLTTEAPLLKPEFPWEGKCIEAPTVYYNKGVWYLFYAGSYNHRRQQIGLATSTDGYHFTRENYFDGNPGLFYEAGNPGTWNQCESGHPGVFEDKNGKVYLFYQGKPTKAGTSSNYSLSALKLTFVEN